MIVLEFLGAREASVHVRPVLRGETSPLSHPVLSSHYNVFVQTQIPSHALQTRTLDIQEATRIRPALMGTDRTPNSR